MKAIQMVQTEIMHDDFKFLMHASGKTLSKDDVVKWVGMKDVKLDKERNIFENRRGWIYACYKRF
jgi:hypothetical protein